MPENTVVLPAAPTNSVVEAAPHHAPPSEASLAPVQQASTSRMLRQLEALSPTGMTRWVQQNPEAINALLAAPPAPRTVSAWWDRLDSQARAILRRTAPQLVGNLDGLPYVARDLANRLVLRNTMQELQAVVDGDGGRTAREHAERRLSMLAAVADALGNDSSQPQRSLLSLDTEDQGRAAIVLGDLRSADYVSYLVPGMFYTVENQMGFWTDASARLYEEQLAWLELLGEDGATVATVAWIGYPTPNLTNVGGIENAEIGAKTLSETIAGLQTLRGAEQPFISVVAHSYGSTAALLALADGDVTIDALAMVGSPGSPAQSVDELHVRNANVFVGEAAWDPVPNSAFFGSDPGAPSFGAAVMGVGGAFDIITNEVLLASTGHNEYFSAGTESMRNFALIGINQASLVTDGTPMTATKALAPSL